MMYYTIILLTSLLTTPISSINAKKDYYWREYEGTIPEDALLAGRDFDGRDAYIGQVYLRAQGLIPIQINSGIKGVYAALNEPKFSKENIKILCGKSDNFAWLQTNSSNVGTDVSSKYPVIGGNEDQGGNYFIGRVYDNDTICIGKVLEIDTENSRMRCVTKFGNMLTKDLYEVLVNV